MSNARTIADLAAVTATATELNALDGITSDVTELNHVDGVTSNVQTQLNSKLGANYTGDVDITGELLVDSYNETFKTVSNSSSTLYYDIANTSYDSVSFNSSPPTTPKDLFLKPDGTKLYIMGEGGDEVRQYSLSTAFDLSTASYDNVLFDVGTQAPGSRTLYFKSDGTKMYVGGDSTDTIWEYDLSTAWNVSTASYNSVNLVLGNYNGLNPEGLEFKPDGTKMYIVGSQDTVYQYALSTAWDLSTASYENKAFNVANEAYDPKGIRFNSDGTRLVVLNDATTALGGFYQYSLSTAYDISTASYDSVFYDIDSESTTVTGPEGLHFSATGHKVYVIDSDVNAVFQYSTSSTSNTTTLNCENANVFATQLSSNTTVVFNNPPTSGTTTAVSGSSYDISNPTFINKLNVASRVGDLIDVHFKPDGTEMYVIGAGTLDTIYQYTLSTAFDLSTASFASKTLDVSGQDAGPTGIFLKPDGTKMFLVGSLGDSVYQYSLSTAWDISSASYDSVSLSVSGQDTSPNGIVFKPDGTSMYIAGNSSDSVFQYTLTTAWNLSTASYASKTFSISSQDTIPYSMAFNADGTKIFVTGLSGDAIYRYSLSTAYDISTASYDSVSFSMSGIMTEGPVGMFFGDSGTKLFLAHSSSDTIFAYFSADTEIQNSTAYAMSLKVVQDAGASGYTVTWPSSVDWPSATAPTLTATASAVDQFVFYTYDGGTTWYGFTAGQALG